MASSHEPSAEAIEAAARVSKEHYDHLGPTGQAAVRDGIKRELSAALAVAEPRIRADERARVVRLLRDESNILRGKGIRRIIENINSRDKYRWFNIVADFIEAIDSIPEVNIEEYELVKHPK